VIYEDREESYIEKKAKKTQGDTFLPSQIDTGILQIFPYEYPQRAIVIEHTTEEFTSICPFSGLPDFGRITIRYSPRKSCLELKSLKYYLFAFRQVKIFNEHVVNKILDDLVKAVKPRWMEVIGEFTSRGGIENKVVATYHPSRRRQ